MRQELNVRVLSCALADFDGEASFDPGPKPSMGRISTTGALRVSILTGDTLLCGAEVEAPDLIKIDVEGAEAAVLRGAGRVMENDPVILLETHGHKAHRECIDLLTVAGYHVCALDGGPPERTNELLAVAARKVKA